MPEAEHDDRTEVETAELEKMVRNERYPLAAGYSARWMIDGNMGPIPCGSRSLCRT